MTCFFIVHQTYLIVWGCALCAAQGVHCVPTQNCDLEGKYTSVKEARIRTKPRPASVVAEVVVFGLAGERTLLTTLRSMLAQRPPLHAYNHNVALYRFDIAALKSFARSAHNLWVAVLLASVAIADGQAVF